MNHLDWVGQICKNERNQKLLEEKAQMLLAIVLKNKSDYQIEKSLKLFAQGIGYLESLLLYQREIHPQQIQHQLEGIQNREEYLNNYKEVESIIAETIQYNYRNVTIALAN